MLEKEALLREAYKDLEESDAYMRISTHILWQNGGEDDKDLQQVLKVREPRTKGLKKCHKCRRLGNVRAKCPYRK